MQSSRIEDESPLKSDPRAGRANDGNGLYDAGAHVQSKAGKERSIDNGQAAKGLRGPLHDPSGRDSEESRQKTAEIRRQLEGDFSDEYVDDDLEDSTNRRDIEENLSIQSQQQIAQDTREPEGRQLSSGEKHSLSDLSEVREGNAHRTVNTKAEEIIKQDGAVSASLGSKSQKRSQRSRLTDGQEQAHDGLGTRHPAQASKIAAKIRESGSNYNLHVDDGFEIEENLGQVQRPAGGIHDRGPGPQPRQSMQSKKSQPVDPRKSLNTASDDAAAAFDDNYDDDTF